MPNRPTRTPKAPRNGSWGFEFEDAGAVFDIADLDLPLDGIGWVRFGLEVRLPPMPAAEFEPVHKEPPKPTKNKQSTFKTAV